MIGRSKPIKLEKWTQGKNASGSLGDTFVQSWTVYAEVEKTGGSRSYEGFQTKMPDIYRMRIRKNDLDVNGLYKVVYRGKRHTVLSIDRENEKDFYYILNVEVK